MTVVVRCDLTVAGVVVGTLELRAASPAHLLDLTDASRGKVVQGLLVEASGDADAGEAAIQLTEDVEYEYDIKCPAHSVVALHPTEVWDGLESVALSGRLKPRRWVGTVELTIQFASGAAKVPVEVRARKLHYRLDYRWMLAGISQRLVDLVLRAFSPAEMAAFAASTTFVDPVTLYQRFAALAAHLRLAEVQAALTQIDRNPDRRYEEKFDERPPGRGRHGNSLHRELTSGGRSAIRLRVNDVEVGLPRTLRSRWFAEDLDTPANRFVRFILEDWRSVASNVQAVLAASSDAGGDGPGARGVLEAISVIAELDQRLAAPIIAATSGSASHDYPAQVIQNRAGYRELYSHWLQTLLAFDLSWSRDDRVPAGTRDVAQAYETWCFLELLTIVERITGASTDARAAVRTSPSGLEVDLSSGQQFSVTTSAFGPTLVATLFYNRSHTRSEDTSWSLQMRPDITLLVGPAGDPEENIVVHFDAKYRIDQVGKGWDDAVSERGVSAPAGDAKRTDLVKMHAYRDAIRRSVGSYVLYPGAEIDNGPAYQLYDELVPGVGAFPLKPSPTGAPLPTQVDGVEAFLGSLFSHVAKRRTRRYRADYWARRAYGDGVAQTRDGGSSTRRPPADTSVLVGFVRSPEHLQWILTGGVYLLRADEGRRGSVSHDSAMLRPDLIALYGPSGYLTTLVAAGRVEVLTTSQIAGLGYPTTSAERRSYFGLPHNGPSEEHVDGRKVADLAAQRAIVGSPFLTSLADVGA